MQTPKNAEPASRPSQNRTGEDSRAFTETPKTEDTERQSAHDLFNQFTADIIRKNTNFTR